MSLACAVDSRGAGSECRGAFTLVEVLAALSLGTIVLLSLHATSRLLTRQSSAVDAESRWMFSAEQVLAAIHNDLTTGFWPDSNDAVLGPRVRVRGDHVRIRSAHTSFAPIGTAFTCYRHDGDAVVLQHFAPDSHDPLSSTTLLEDVARFTLTPEPRGLTVRIESARGSVVERLCPVHPEALRAP
jgi:hypothetical protein